MGGSASEDDVDVTLPLAEEVTSAPGPRGARRSSISRGRFVGRYVVIEELGSGGMSVVYRAYDPELDRVVALKLLHAAGEHGSGGTGGEARLLREAQAMAKLSHPNVIVVHDVGTHDGQVFLAMEYVDGETLGAWTSETARGWREVVRVFIRAGEGLAAAHRAQLVHRDFKPDNVLVGRDGRLRVLDFGLVHFAGAAEATDDPSGIDSVSSALQLSLTQTGAVMGTPAYMSPEQVTGKAATEQSDQFSFCVALYEALYGERPFKADNLAELATKIVQQSVPDAPSGSGVPGWVRRAVLRGLSKRPTERFDDMPALLAELRRDPARRRRRVFLGGTIVALSATTGLLAAQWVGENPAPRCTGGPQHVAQVWDDGGRAAIRASFEASALPTAAASADEVTAGIDAYTAEWGDRHREACLAAERGESSAKLLDLQMSCLSGRLDSVRGAVTVLADADADVVRNAAKVVAGLPPLSRCADAESLQSELAPPEDTERWVEFGRVRALMTETNALDAAGRIKRAAELADETLVAARALDHAPLLAEALLNVGRLAETLGDLDRAHAMLEDAYHLAIETKRDRVAATAAADIGVVLGIRKGNWELAGPWQRTALSLARRIEPDGVLEGDVLTGIAERDSINGDLEGAHNNARRAHEIAVAATGERSTKAADTAQHLAYIVNARGDNEEALRLATLALDVRTERLGGDHPDVGGALAVLGVVLGDLGRGEEQLETLTRSVEISTAVYGRRSRAVGSALVNMTNAARELGRIDEARAFIVEAIDIYGEIFGPDHPKMGGALMVLALVDDDAERLDDAVTHYRASLAILRAHYGEEHPSVAGALHNLGGVYVRRQQSVEALDHFERALKICEAVLGPDHPQTALTRTDYGATLVTLERADEAIPQLRAALVQRIAQPATPSDLAHTQFALATALWAGGQRDEALQQARDAERIYVEHPDLHDPRADEIRAWLSSRAS